MMKVLFVVYHDVKIEARSQETLEALKMLGQVDVITIAAPFPAETANFHISKYNKFIPGLRYLLFINEAKKYIKKQPDLVFFHDILLLTKFVKKKSPNSVIVYDQSELNIERKIVNLKSLILKFIDFIEKRKIKYADVIYTANIERSNYTRDFYKLKETPLVFDNIHRIDDKFDEEQCNSKYGYLFNNNSFKIVAGGGIWKDRFTYDLIRAVMKTNGRCSLVIVGNSPEGLSVFNSLIKDNVYNNVHYLGFVPRNEWRFLLSKANCSFTGYANISLNYHYCASGKTYESLFEGVPILTSGNPPLKRLCIEYGVGVSNDDLDVGLMDIIENYEKYKLNASRFSEIINYDDRIVQFMNSIYNAYKRIRNGQK